MNLLDNLKQLFKHGNALIQLIYINVAVFAGIKAISILFLLFNSSTSFLSSYLALPADFALLPYRIWTPLSYMFLHEAIFHILFNMIALYWFGQIFLMYFSEKQLVGLYLFGGLIAASFYLIAYNLFPYYAGLIHQSLLLGASGSIMAIIVAAALRAPNMELQLMLIGAVKLKFIAIASVLISFFGITSQNGGGELAHLGGALAGYLFVVSLQQGKDLTRGFNWILDKISSLFRPRKLRVKQNQFRKSKTMNDAEFNINKAKKMAEIDKILDKIKTSGYESLSSEEKKRLFEQSNK